ncbi:MAG: DUF444 family protein [Pseudomonadota bacterium]|nr:DUF444 family protein [Pseudomonadota bacterium]
MPIKMDSDLSRFHKIVRGKVKKELRKFIANGELLARKGEKTVKIPLPRVEMPRFQYGDNKGGVGQGDGEIGDEVKQPQQSEEEQQAGDKQGEHGLEAEVTIEELAQLLGEELELPNIASKGKDTVESSQVRYTGIHKQGPESLRHFKRTFRESLKRSIISGVYDADDPVILPIKSDMRYRSFRRLKNPETSAVIFYMMDVSGSMGELQKKLVRFTSFWIDAWLNQQYKGIETRYIVHDAVAQEVDKDKFYRLREAGGTLISSAYMLALDIMRSDYPHSDWNIYMFHFSDGDNWSSNDTNACIKMINDDILPYVNLFSYGQVESRYGSGQFFRNLADAFPAHERVAMAKIKDQDAIVGAIKSFLGRGK